MLTSPGFFFKEANLFISAFKKDVSEILVWKRRDKRKYIVAIIFHKILDGADQRSSCRFYEA